MKFALQTSAGNYVTAISGGGVGGANDATCPVHTDATLADAWEGFILEVDDTVNPPTVIIRTQTGNFVTAVNGGGVNGGNAQPIHTDVTTVGSWEQFLFNFVALAGPSIKITWSANINGPANGNIAATSPITLTLNQDGSWSFSGTFNNSNWLPYNISVAMCVIGSKGTTLRFGTSGFTDAALPWDNNNWTFSLSGTNNGISAAWDELVAGWTWRAQASASPNLSGLWTAIENSAGSIVGTVVTIIGAF
jgi:hypothetical protein